MVEYEYISLNYKNIKKTIKVRRLSFFSMIRGLMFRGKSFSDCLFFKFNKKYGYSIHSYFVFFDFLAVWLDDKNNVCEIKKVTPFTFLIKPKKPFYRLIEVPFNNNNKKIINFFVGKRKI